MTATNLEVLFTPADFDVLGKRDLSDTTCVVFDVLRATSSIVTALSQGARSVKPVLTIEEALDMRAAHPEVLLAGERDGLRIEGNLSNNVTFDFGNSPREFLDRPLTGRTIVITTTNGTRALRACAKAQRILVSCFLNLDRTAGALANNPPAKLLVICSGTFEEAAYEDTLAAGALCDRLWKSYDGHASDSALMSRKLWLQESSLLEQALREARNGRRLLTRPALAEDVAFCARLNVFPLVAEMDSTRGITLKS